MSTSTKIEWADATWNPVVGCTRVSEGCRNCYAERFAARFPDRFGHTSRMTEHGPMWTGKVVLRPEVLRQPLRWRKPRRVFINSMSDLFHPEVPLGFLDRVFAVMSLASHHTFMILTKRQERMQEYITNRAAKNFSHRKHVVWPLPNVWLGVSVEDQHAADERIPFLLQTPAAVRFVSCEPLLGPVDLSEFKPFDGECYCQDRPDGCKPSKAIGCSEATIDWVVVGGESGPGARPMNPDWVRSLRDQCQEAGVPFFLKQMHIGRKLVKMPELDGRRWDELPRF